MFSPTGDILNVRYCFSFCSPPGDAVFLLGVYFLLVSPTLTEVSIMWKYWLTCLIDSAGVNSLRNSFCIFTRIKKLNFNVKDFFLFF